MFHGYQVRTILDIGCGYGSFGAHLFSKELLTMCLSEFEASGSQVQLTLERGLPAMLGSLNSKQFPTTRKIESDKGFSPLSKTLKYR